MISTLFIRLIIPFLIAIFLAVTMGGSGTGPAFSAAYGANCIKKTLIPGLFGIMVLLGAVIAGNGTATTMGKEILAPEMMSFTIVSIILFSVAITLLISNLVGIPQSTTQAAVLSVSGVALYLDNLNYDKLFFEIIPTWFILPIVSFILTYLLGKYVYKRLKKKYTLFQNDEKDSFQPIWKVILISISLYVSFSIGANNVAIAAGPIAAMTANELSIDIDKHFMLIMILANIIVAPSFGIGSSIFGHKIVKSTGKEIVTFDKFEAVIISFVSASLLLTASITKGIPTSLVQLTVAAILGVGIAKNGFNHYFQKTKVRKFFLMWLFAPIIAFSLSILFVHLAEKYGIIISF